MLRSKAAKNATSQTLSFTTIKVPTMSAKTVQQKQNLWQSVKQAVASALAQGDQRSVDRFIKQAKKILGLK